MSLHIIVLIVRGCFDRTHGLNKLFLHLMRVLFLCLIIISHLIFSMYIINMKSHDFSCAIWNKQALVNFFKDHKLHWSYGLVQFC